MTPEPLNDARKQLCRNAFETMEKMLDIIDQQEIFPQDENFTDDVQQRIEQVRERWNIGKN